MITLPVREVVRATPRLRIISLELGPIPFRFAAGQAVMVGLHRSLLRKPYSIASAPSEVSRSGVMHLLLQIEEGGSPDPHLELAEPGTLLDVDGPFGSFGLPQPDTGTAPLLFLAGGTGIAPFRSMLIERLAQPGAPPMAVVYSARSADELAFRAELEAVQRAGRVDLYLTVTRGNHESWSGRQGRVDEALVRQALPGAEALCLLCGPPELVRAVRNLLLSIGVTPHRILAEQYQ